jgi:hypothetical protein
MGIGPDVPWDERSWPRATSGTRVATEERALLALQEISLQVPAFAISLCHCKNVKAGELQEGEQSLPRKHRDRFPNDRWRVLEIDSQKKALREAGADGSPESFIRALHICRGHFAVYTPEHPLFGKYVGHIWRPMHVRGGPEAGIVEKDYSIKAPTSSGTADDSGQDDGL